MGIGPKSLLFKKMVPNPDPRLCLQGLFSNAFCPSVFPNGESEAEGKVTTGTSRWLGGGTTAGLLG